MLSGQSSKSNYYVCVQGVPGMYVQVLRYYVIILLINRMISAVHHTIRFITIYKEYVHRYTLLPTSVCAGCIAPAHASLALT
jgi:hypothetical protein